MYSTGLVLNIQATLLTFSAEVQNVFNVLKNFILVGPKVSAKKI